jgi:hypothetical protein
MGLIRRARRRGRMNRIYLYLIRMVSAQEGKSKQTSLGSGKWNYSIPGYYLVRNEDQAYLGSPAIDQSGSWNVGSELEVYSMP